MTRQVILDDLVQAVSRHRDADQLVIQVAADRRLLEQVKEAYSLLGRNPSSVLSLCRKYGMASAWFEERVRLLVRVLNLAPEPDNLYDILGLEENASEDDIKRAYRRLSRQWHPDLNPDNPDAAEAFIKMKNAYEILSNPELRRHYDRQRLKPWMESFHGENQVEASNCSTRRRSRRFAFFLAALIAPLLAVTFFGEFDDLLIRRYYTENKQGMAVSQKQASPVKQVSVQGLTALLYPFQKNAMESRWHMPSEPMIENQKEDSNIGTTVKNPNLEPAVTQADHSMQKPMADPPKIKEPSAPPVETPTVKTTSALSAVARLKERQAAEAQVQPHKKTTLSSLKEPMSPKVEKPLKTTPVRPQATASQDALASSAFQASKPAPPEDNLKAVVQDPNSKKIPLAFEGITEKDIHAFLERYCRTYSRRDLLGFLSLFTADALENGKPIGSLRHLYEKNFARTERLDYRIRLERWSLLEDKVRVAGRFDLVAVFHDKSGVHSEGTVKLTLLPFEKGFQVSSLDYDFSNSERFAFTPESKNEERNEP